jgi:hypothetical protein
MGESLPLVSSYLIEKKHGINSNLSFKMVASVKKNRKRSHGANCVQGAAAV